MRSVLRNTRLVAVLAIILVAGFAGVAIGVTNSDVGKALIIGNTTQNAGTSNTALTTSSTGNAWKMQNNGTGSGIRGVATGTGNGGSFTSTNAQGRGIYTENTAGTFDYGAGILSWGGNTAGVIGYSSNGTGLAGAVIGFDVSEAQFGNGVYGDSALGEGVFGFGYDTMTPTGAGANGGLFQNTTDGSYALEAVGCDTTMDPPFGCPGGTPLSGHFTGDVLMENNLTINGTCTGCTLGSLAINGTKSTIKQGTALTITGAKVDAATKQTVLLIAPARSGQQIIGVAAGAMRPQTIVARSATAPTSRTPWGVARIHRHNETVYVASRSSGVKPGGVMLVITHGLFSFGVGDASAGAIRAGDSLGAGSAGHLVRLSPVKVAGISFLAPGSSVGYALGSVQSGSRVITIFVNPH